MRSLRSAFVLIFIALSPQPSALLRARLAGLLLQDFARIANAFLLVRVRLAQSPDVRGDLTDELPVDARHGDVRLLVDGHVNALRDVEHDRVRVPEGEDHLLPLDLRAVADADDIELLLKPLGDAMHGVRDE